VATLEVHDGQGRVERVTIAREQPILFGSSPKCDIILNGPGVLPFHGRIRWKARRYKADASPQAAYIELNGRKIRSGSFRQGDEIQVGPCRIFLIRVDDDLERRHTPQDDRTRVQPPPGAHPRRRRLDRDDWLRDVEMAPPSVVAKVETATAVPAPGARAEGDRPGPRPEPAAPARPWERIARLFSAPNVAPGQEKIVSSPLVLGLMATLVLLVFLGLVLKGIIARTVATRLYNRAVEDLDIGDYRTALRRFDEFLAANPADARAGKARVLRALANVRQFASTTGASWSHALEAARAMVADVSREPAYRDSSPELDELVLKAGEALADRSRAAADALVLAEAESAVALHQQVAGQSAAALLARSQLPAKLAEARAAVRKAEARSRGLAAMDVALRAGSPVGVFAARDALVGQYADLSSDRELIVRMTRANELIRRAVRLDPARRPAATAPHRERLGPPTTLVLRASPVAPAKPSDGEESPPQAAAESGPIVFALAEGFAYGLDATSGAPLWHIPVGLSAPFPPQPVPGETTALVTDARHDELVLVQARTGALVWRQAIGEPISDPPLVLGDQIIQATPGGKLYGIDLKSGELRETLDLGRRLVRTPVSDETGRFLYVLAQRDSLFIIQRDPLACSAVEYLGHDAGALPCSPARVGRFLVVAENHALNAGRWRVFVLDQDGARPKPVQQVPVAGWTWGTPAASNSVIWATGDRGDVAAYAIGSYDAPDPFRLIARLNPDAQPSGPAYAWTRSESELWLSSGRPGRYGLDAQRGAIAPGWTLADTGPALAPLQAAGPLIVLTQQDTESPGVAVWGVDPASASVRWRTVLGAPWPAPPAGSRRAEALTTLAVDGRAIVITEAQLDSGGFVELPLPRPGGFRLPPGPLQRLDTDELTVLVPTPHANHLLIRAEGEGEAQGDRGVFRKVELPTPLGAAALLWGRDVLVPGGDGRAYVVDLRTGESRAEPFVPPFDRAHPTRWRAPVSLDGDAVALADEAGRVRRLIRVDQPRPRLVVTAEVGLDAGLAANPASTGGAVVLATTDGRIRALAARDLSPLGAWPLEGPLALPPVSVAGRGFAGGGTGDVLALGLDGQRLWSIRFPDAAPSGPPVVRDQAVWFLTRDGALHRRALADGAPLDRIELGILPAGALHAVGTDLAVPVAPGTFRMLKK
jgi:outer membrane protein assembly factor BamB